MRRDFLKALSLNVAVLALLLCGQASMAASRAEYDIVVYGGTSAGVIAAVQAVRMGKSAIDSDLQTMGIFEPHVAERVFEELVAEYDIPVHRNQWLDRDHGVRMNGTQIESVTMLSGRTFRGRVFIDATYEGDLMAAAGIDFHVGREANSKLSEQSRMQTTLQLIRKYIKQLRWRQK